jgi:PTS system mannose-specific IIB component/fructoselysine and glucoselysine-specific PTS system IIB component
LASEVPEITSINFGGIRGKDGSRLISKAIAVTDEDIAVIRQMLGKGLELEVRQVPTDKKQMVGGLI